MLMSREQAVLFKNGIIGDLEDISAAIRENFDEMDIENVTLYDDIDFVITNMQGSILEAIAEIEAITYE
ncbi:MAG: hypothetical protein K2K56_03805 [Lachnospiraceae bacterium]|nr:hypothetical protein [Lachnospiraceae bacterium]